MYIYKNQEFVFTIIAIGFIPDSRYRLLAFTHNFYPEKN